jgi:hypothetical protein
MAISVTGGLRKRLPAAASLTAARHKNDDDQIDKRDGPRSDAQRRNSGEGEPEVDGKGNQCDADGAEQDLCSDMPESMRRGFRHVPPIER